MTWCTVLFLLYTERAEMDAVSRDTSYVTTKRRCKYTTSVDIQKCAIKSESLIQNHICDMSALSLLEIGQIAVQESDQLYP